MSLFDPVSHALAAVVAAAHAALSSLGLDPASGTAWLLSVAAVVLTVRVALLPLVVHGVRQAHAGARARPQLRELGERYRRRTDAESLRAYAEERRAVSAQHGVSRLGCLPLLVQLPVWLGLFHLLSTLAEGTPVGALDGGLVAGIGAATLLGVPLAERGYLGAGPAHLAVVAGLAASAALLSFVTQRYLVAPNTVTDGLPEAVARVQQLLPAASAVGLLIAGGAVPVVLLASWVLNSLWTLAQSAVVWRFFPTPGSPAAG